MIVTLECGTASKKIELTSRQTLVRKIWKDVFFARTWTHFPLLVVCFIVHIAMSTASIC